MDTETIFFKALNRRDVYEKDPSSDTFYKYSHYRESIAEDCEYRCVYCDSHENDIGGREAMELDHFRPWNKGFGKHNEKKFEHLKHEPTNLVHSCGVCNSFKWSHWPTEDPARCYDNEKGWIEPFKEVRSDFFAVGSSGEISAKRPPAQYQIGKLRLNRPLLRRLREFRLLKNSIAKLEKKLQAVIEHDEGSAHAQTAAEVLAIFSNIRRLSSSDW